MERVTRGILDNISQDTKELIVVFDGCTDNSESIFDKVILEHQGKIDIVKTYTPDVWETKANNVGMKLSQCDFSCIVQDDMVICEDLFDQRLKKPLNLFSDCFAVSGRAAHNDVLIKGKTLECTNLIGRENLTGDKRYIKKLKCFLKTKSDGRDIFGIRDVVNRGPLLLDNEIIKKVNYLDELFAPLDFDDHDLCYRVYKELGLLCGSYTVRYQSELEWGGTRANTQAIKVQRDSHDKNEKILIERHFDLITGRKHNENRRIKT